MKKLPKPIFSASDTYILCIEKIRDADLKNRLSQCESLIVDAESEFNLKIAKGSIYTIKKETVINKNVEAKELEKVYTYRMAKKSAPGRLIYDKIISMAELEVCPLCNHGIVETLDHYLPKSSFPRLSVTPINLIPSCYSCNKKKLTSIPSNSYEETLHPYYDDIENENWIFAKVNKTSPPSLTFFIMPPKHWSEMLKKRVEYHFYSFELDKLYSKQAAVWLRNLSVRLSEIYLKKDSNGVRKYLKDEAKSLQKIDLNSWQSVLYSTIYKDDWYCSGGFEFPNP